MSLEDQMSKKVLLVLPSNRIIRKRIKNTAALQMLTWMVVATMSGINLMGSWMIRSVARAVNTLLALSGMPQKRHAPNVTVETNTGDNQKTTELYALRYNTLDSHFISTSRLFSICALNPSSHACTQSHIT